MRVILIEKNPDLQFTSNSTAILKINSLVLPDLNVDGVQKISVPLYMKSATGLSNPDLEVIVKPTRELAAKGVFLLCAYLDGDSLEISLLGRDSRLSEGMDAFIVSFVERVQVKSVEKAKADSVKIDEKVELAPKSKKARRK